MCGSVVDIDLGPIQFRAMVRSYDITPIEDNSFPMFVRGSPYFVEPTGYDITIRLRTVPQDCYED